ncbi:MAG: ribosomal RNA small subunit methyltransferase A [Clostridia bacterium]|nr:ribosomal RNA small subunit methyltransferase A [Clostridia bacterium]
MNLCDINTLKPLLKRHGFTFSKGLGQNFLCEESVPVAIAEGAGVDKDTCVIEVGPGVGALTKELLVRADRVTAIELDKRLPALLKETVGDFDNFDLVEGDILKVNLKEICAAFESKRVVACANLPYYITTPAISTLIESGCFESITVMVQREVARRICAKPGTSDYGAFTPYIDYHATASVVCEVDRECFIPAPNVDSTVVRLDIRKTPPVDVDEKALFKLIKAAFAQRRKTLVNCLSFAYKDKISKSELEEILVSMDLSKNVRGEELSLIKYAELLTKLP